MDFQPASNVGDDVYVYDENNNHIETFYFLRQQMKKKIIPQIEV